MKQMINPEDNINNKIMTLAFVACGFIAAIVTTVLLETLASASGFFARYYSQDWLKHGGAVVLGVVTFASLQFNKKVLIYCDEAVTELRKVVWPSKKDTAAMTLVTCIMLIVSGVILGVFDMVSSNLVQMIVN